MTSFSSPSGQANAYVGAYPFMPGRRAVWREIVRYVLRDVQSLESVVEFGAGYCDFINQVPAKQRIVFDLNPEMRTFAEPGVEWRNQDASEISNLPANSVGLVFASNFFEHLDGDAGSELLDATRMRLQTDGRLILLQPNHRLCADHYFDDPTHVSIFDDLNIGPWLEAHGYRIRRLVPGLLPFSMKSRAPKWPFLVRCYLNSPIRPLSAQMYVVAERA